VTAVRHTHLQCNIRILVGCRIVVNKANRCFSNIRKWMPLVFIEKKLRPHKICRRVARTTTKLTFFSFIRTNQALVRGMDFEYCLCARIAQNATSKNGVSLLGLLWREMSILLIRDIEDPYMNFCAGDVYFSQLNRCKTYYRVWGL
jgi:hypothetical protein